MVYLPVMLASVAVMVPVIIVAEKYRRMKAALLGSVAALAVSQIMLAFADQDVYVILATITRLFCGL